MTVSTRCSDSRLGAVPDVFHILVNSFKMINRFKNLDKPQNTQLANHFSWLLKASEDCTPSECCWAGVTVFDHWLYEDHSYWRISEATDVQKCDWGQKIDNFMHELIALDTPLHFKYRGRPRKNTGRLQFAAFNGVEPMEAFLRRRYDESYYPQMVLSALGIDIRFGDDWTRHLTYCKLADFMPVCAMAARLGLPRL